MRLKAEKQKELDELVAKLKAATKELYGEEYAVVAPDDPRLSKSSRRGAEQIVVRVAKRDDGSYRQIAASNPDGSRVFCFFFKEGSVIEQKPDAKWSQKPKFGDVFKLVKGKKFYHWADPYSDDELKEFYTIADSDIPAIRKEASEYNKQKTVCSRIPDRFKNTDKPVIH